MLKAESAECIMGFSCNNSENIRKESVVFYIS